MKMTKLSYSLLPYLYNTKIYNNYDPMKSIIDELDEILVDVGKYPNKDEVKKDALRALLRAKPELKKDVAIELYKKGVVSLSRAAEIYGSNIEEFKELLKERGIKIEVPHIPVEEIDKEVESIVAW
jgi:predicted HTH domain antitoxin